MHIHTHPHNVLTYSNFYNENLMILPSKIIASRAFSLSPASAQDSCSFLEEKPFARMTVQAPGFQEPLNCHMGYRDRILRTHTLPYRPLASPSFTLKQKRGSQTVLAFLTDF